MCLGVPGQIVELISIDDHTAVVDVAGVKRPVNIACILEDDASTASIVGEWVLVHVGFAMSRIDADEAARTLAMLEELGELQDESESMPDGAR